MLAIFLGCTVVTYLVALYSSLNFFWSYFGGLERLVLSFLFEYTNWSFQ